MNKYILGGSREATVAALRMAADLIESKTMDLDTGQVTIEHKYEDCHDGAYGVVRRSHTGVIHIDSKLVLVAARKKP